MGCDTSFKVSPEMIEFTKRLKANRIKADTDEVPLSYPKLWNLIVNYFKMNNTSYLELVQMEEIK